MTKPFYILNSLILVLIVSACGANKNLNYLEKLMSKNSLFPLDTTNLSQSEILRINFKNGSPTDTIACTYYTSEQKGLYNDKDVEVMVRIYNDVFFHRFADGMALFEDFKIYKYKKHNSILDEGFKYQIKYENQTLEYFFSNEKIPRKIKQLDSLLIEKYVLLADKPMLK